jgi:methylmalonyl-CoA/ethylmalonyl-CoA epimerase
VPFRLHHIGFVVPSLDAGRAIFSNLGFDVTTPEYTDAIQRVSVQFIKPATEVFIELIAPLDDKSPVTRFLAKGGAGLHHVCYEVPDIDAASMHLQRQGSVITC